MGAAGCLAVAVGGSFASALTVLSLILVVLIAVIASERVAWARRRAPTEPLPPERLTATAPARD